MHSPACRSATRSRSYVLFFLLSSSFLFFFAALANGELLLEATDTSLASGRGAVGTFATWAEFDDVILSRLRP
jgi:hypothetical protein